MEGPVNKRFADAKSRAVLIEFLATELEAARMIALTEQKSPKKGEVTVNESDTAAALKTILQSLGLSRPPENVTSALIFGKAKARVSNLRNRAISSGVSCASSSFTVNGSSRESTGEHGR